MAADPFGQNGDPEKAAKVIVEAINKEDPPKMILLGEGQMYIYSSCMFSETALSNFFRQY